MSNAARLERAFTRNDKPETTSNNPANRFASRPGSPESLNLWVEHRSAEYVDMIDQWEFVDAHYTGDLLRPDKIELFLYQREQSESDSDFKERKKIASQPYHLSFIFDTFAGLASAADRNVKIILNEGDDLSVGLGDPETRGTFAHSILNNIDGTGKNWDPFWQSFITSILRFHLVYIVTNGVVEETVRDAEGNENTIEIAPPHLRVLPPTAVTNVFFTGTRMTAAVVKHLVDVRETIEDEPITRTRYTVYRLDGSETYEIRVDGTKKRVVHLPELDVEYEYWDSEDQNYKILPIFPVRLAFDRYLGYQAARRLNSIFNMESERDAAVRRGNLARLVLVGSDGFFRQIKSYIVQGFNALRQDPKQTKDHYYLNPPVEPARLAGEIIKDRLQDFLFTTFREYTNAAKQKTATEIDQDRRAGLESLLVVLLDALTEAQNNALFRLEQSFIPGKPDAWGIARIVRDPDFQYVSNREIIERLVDLVFPGQPLPVGNTGLKSAVRRIANYFGIEYDDTELDARVDATVAQDAQTRSALAEFGV